MLDMSIDSSSGLRVKSDGWMLLGRIAQNHLGRDLALNFIVENWEQVKREYVGQFFKEFLFINPLFTRFDAFSNLSQMLEMVTKLINTDAELKMVKN